DKALDDDALEKALADAESDAVSSEDDVAASDRDTADAVSDGAGITSGNVVAIPDVLRIAVVGRPNAGKSSFINKLLGEERHLVSELPGTTVDSIDSFLEYGGRRWRLIDTAGIRRKRSIGGSVEKHAVVSALKG